MGGPCAGRPLPSIREGGGGRPPRGGSGGARAGCLSPLDPAPPVVLRAEAARAGWPARPRQREDHTSSGRWRRQWRGGVPSRNGSLLDESCGGGAPHREGFVRRGSDGCERVPRLMDSVAGRWGWRPPVARLWRVASPVSSDQRCSRTGSSRGAAATPPPPDNGLLLPSWFSFFNPPPPHDTPQLYSTYPNG